MELHAAQVQPQRVAAVLVVEIDDPDVVPAVRSAAAEAPGLDAASVRVAPVTTFTARTEPSFADPSIMIRVSGSTGLMQTPCG